MRSVDYKPECRAAAAARILFVAARRDFQEGLSRPMPKFVLPPTVCGSSARLIKSFYNVNYLLIFLSSGSALVVHFSYHFVLGCTEPPQIPG